MTAVYLPEPVQTVMQGWHQFPVNSSSPFCVMYLDGKLLGNTCCWHCQVSDSVLVSKHLGPSFSHHEISVNANSERVAHKIEHTWLQCQANFKHFNIPEPVTRVQDILIHCWEKRVEKKDTQNLQDCNFTSQILWAFIALLLTCTC